MTRGTMHDYALTMPHAVCNFKEEWDVFLYLIDAKMFGMMGTNKEGEAIFTLKCNPARAVELREKYPDIKPGYYMSKNHWNSIHMENTLPDGLMKELIAHSYELVFHSLTRKRQQELSRPE